MDEGLSRLLLDDSDDGLRGLEASGLCRLGFRSTSGLSSKEESSECLRIRSESLQDISLQFKDRNKTQILPGNLPSGRSVSSIS